MAEFLSNPDVLKPLTKTRKENINLETLTKEELIEKVKSLELHVQQLRNVIAKKDESALPSAKGKQKERKFDFDKFKRRHILLQVSYLGWNYLGFATQEDAGKTIESELFAALIQTKLVEDRAGCNYHRCGRTDRGVSGTGQVISLDVRTNLVTGPGVHTQPGYTGPEEENDKEEIDFCSVLNRNLPDDIRVTAWAPAPRPDFSARFDCESRSYHYYFPRGNLDIGKMESAASRLLGVHDFRNLCKMDVNNGVVSFVRRIDSVRVDVIAWQKEHSLDKDELSGYDICRLTIKSKAFLWHQIRCIVAVLLMIGEGLEEEDVIEQLLDIETNPCRPAYSMASDLPLNLYRTEYQELDWRSMPVSRELTIKATQKLWAEHALKAAIIRGKLEELEFGQQKMLAQAESLLARRKEKKYTKLMELPRCPSLEEKIKTVAKKRKIEIPAPTNACDNDENNDKGDDGNE